MEIDTPVLVVVERAEIERLRSEITDLREANDSLREIVDSHGKVREAEAMERGRLLSRIERLTALVAEALEDRVESEYALGPDWVERAEAEVGRGG